MIRDIEIMNTSDRILPIEETEQPKPSKVYCKYCVWCEERQDVKDMFQMVPKHLCGCPEELRDSYFEPVKQECRVINQYNQCKHYKGKQEK